MRFLTTAFLLFCFSSAAAAQVPEEYNNVPPGLMMDKQDPHAVIPAAGGGMPQQASDAPQAATLTMSEVTAAYHDGKFDIAARGLPVLAANGDHAAEELLGLIYRSGQGVEKNPSMALLWLNRAAEAKRPLAMHHLGIIYYTGEGVAADNVAALTWLKLATLYYPDGPEKKRATEDHDNLAAQTSRRDKDAALDAARAWLKKKGESNLLDAQ